MTLVFTSSGRESCQRSRRPCRLQRGAAAPEPSSKSSKGDERQPLFQDSPGAIATLLAAAASSSRAVSAPAPASRSKGVQMAPKAAQQAMVAQTSSKKQRGKAKHNASASVPAGDISVAAAVGELADVPRLAPADHSVRWEEHAARLESYLSSTCGLVAENTFIALAPLPGHLERSNSAPGSLAGCSPADAEEDLGTPELWHSPSCIVPPEFQLPASTCASGTCPDLQQATSSQVTFAPAQVPPEQPAGDLLQWLTSSMLRCNSRILELEQRVAVLELENAQLRAASCKTSPA